MTLTLSPIFIFAQHGIVLKDTLIIHPLKVGTSVIGATYQGDLNKTWEKFNLGFNLNLQFEKRKKIMPQINLTSGTVTGQDPKFNSKKDKYNSFVRTSFTGLDLRLLYRFTPKQKGTFYLGLGSGILFFNPKDINDRSLLEDKTSRAENETYSNVSFILPSLVGYRYYINPYTNLYFEAVSFNPQTKYLDNINRLGSHKKNDRLFSLNLGVQLSPSQWIQKSYKKPISVPSDELRKGMIAIQKSENELSTLENNHLSIIPIKLIGVTGIKGGIQLQYDEKVSLDEENYQKLQKIGVKLKEAPAKNAYITIEVSGNQDKELIKAQAEAIYLYLKSIILQSGINPQRVYVLYQTKMIKNPSFRIDKITLQIR
ncbi:MAG: hypothetical protein NZ455_08070 [Bacteroidia bacterium]|nr:hypothetical protein [Bacteroidia bacterium]MDW8346671.1 hypothetical protein [Bacteroidia bacterium]